MYREIINRKWGHTMARSWARLMLDRLGEYVGQRNRGRRNDGFQDEEEDVHERNNYHNPPGSGRGYSHGVGSSEGS